MRYTNKLLFCLSVLLLLWSPVIYGQDQVVSIALQRASLRQLLTAINGAPAQQYLYILSIRDKRKF